MQVGFATRPSSNRACDFPSHGFPMFFIKTRSVFDFSTRRMIENRYLLASGVPWHELHRNHLKAFNRISTPPAVSSFAQIHAPAKLHPSCSDAGEGGGVNSPLATGGFLIRNQRPAIFFYQRHTWRVFVNPRK